MPASTECDPEQPVVEAVLQGDRYAFDELCRRHSDWVRAVIFGVLCDRERIDDVAQQVWTTFWEQIGRLRNPSRWRPWLYRLARNAAVDAGRQGQRRKRAAERVGAASPAETVCPSPGDAAVRAEQHQAVADAVQALPALYREPFVLRHVQGWSYRQISEVMGLRTDTVETRLVRARRRLREALRDKV
ncbi:MAG: RNA polymerase sigma factor [Phycisphaerae bacterium]